MKSVFIILTVSLLFFSCGTQQKNIASIGDVVPVKAEEVGDAPFQSIRIINHTSLKSLRGVIRDLSLVMNGSVFQEKFLLGKEGLTVRLYDFTSGSFSISAQVMNTFNATTFNVKINRFNEQADDKALAATLIHEIMHCILINIYRRAQKQDEQALNSIINFGLSKSYPSDFHNDFFDIMNAGERGSHELMYHLFYPQMVLLLERFAETHKQTLNSKEAEFLMWSGLQNIDAYQKLSDEKKYKIELAILKAKGFEVEAD
jgi:hypothetical protein